MNGVSTHCRVHATAHSHSSMGLDSCYGWCFYQRVGGQQQGTGDASFFPCVSFFHHLEFPLTVAKPVVNPMLGPSTSALIQLGARFPSCMKLVAGIPLDTKFGCKSRLISHRITRRVSITGLNNAANPPDILCSLEQICGFGGFRNKTPNQWFRLVVGSLYNILNLH